MSKEDKIRAIVESWKAPRRLKEDTWQNVQLVLTHYGFTFERKSEWVCTHSEFMELARNPRAKDLLRNYKLGVRGDFSLAVTHGANTKAGMVKRCYLNDILKYIELLEFIRGRKEQS
ncbi:MAG: hypothetical protein IJT02_08050 [Synergistaceae bacterium]|nr:hypothetical protein [Synergistaceae bacterium]